MIFFFAKNLALLNRNARKESVRLTPFRDSTTQYNSPQYTAVLRILRRAARSAAEIAERTATQHWGPEMENRRRGGPRSGVGWPWPPAGHFCSDADQTCSHAHDPHRAHAGWQTTRLWLRAHCRPCVQLCVSGPELVWLDLVCSPAESARVSPVATGICLLEN